MAKIQFDGKGVSFMAEGNDDSVLKSFNSFIGDGQKLVEAAKVFLKMEAPVLEDIQHDVVAIYDDAGIPSFMHRFRRMTNKELFGGSEKVHPAFVIGGEAYDEIYISVYQNTMINGKPYSLPFAKPIGNITQDEFAKACFSKGEGWHCLTAPEWGLLADLSLKLGTLPHGNTYGGCYHADRSEKGVRIGSSYQTLTGSGPETWTHNHKKTGVHDLTGNGWEFCLGVRMKDGQLQAAKNNDAALPETDLSENGKDWEAVKDDAGKPIYISVGGEIIITTCADIEEGYAGRRWEGVSVRCESEQLKELALFAGDPKNYFFADSTEGEYILFRGGGWSDGEGYGVFSAYLAYDRSNVYDLVGGRSAYFKKHSSLDPETLNGER